MNDRPESAPRAEPIRPEIELSQLDLRYEGHRLRQRGRAFFVQCHLLTGSLLSRAKGFLHIVKELHDRSRKA